MSDKIVIRGARVHNLKNINVDIPRNKLVVITGLSGSGKSSLAFDTIYAEGQRRYVESLSAYARQFLGLMDKPDVDKIEGLSPAISIDQKSASHNPRSTVGTVTEIYDYLRLLYARVGTPHCPVCGKKITGQSVTQMVDQIVSWPESTKIVIMAPLVRDQKGEHKHLLEEAKKSGYQRIRFDGTIMDLSEALQLNVDKKKKHTIDIVVDRISLDSGDRARIADSLETALDLGNDSVIIAKDEKDLPAMPRSKQEIEAWQAGEILLSSNFACPEGHTNLPELNPRNFSFNSPHGACPDCTGLGTRLEIEAELVIPNKRLTLAEGAIRPWSKTTSRMSWYSRVLEAVSKVYGFSIHVPVRDLPKKALDAVLYGTGDTKISFQDESGYGHFGPFEGVVHNLMRKYKETESDYMRGEIEQYMRVQKCPTCKGKRLKPEFLAVTIDAKSIVDVSNFSIDEAIEFTESLPKKMSEKDMKIAHQIFKEIVSRLKFLQDVGLNYLTLDRSADTLSGGEAQRIRLATQIGSGLTGVLYILDEPSIGLHQRDNDRLLRTLKNLRDLGNTVIVVEHDEETIWASDWVVDIGPGAGKHGGQLVAEGTPNTVAKDKNSLTGKYMSGAESVSVPMARKKGNGKTIKVVGATEHNLKNIDVEIPLGKFVCLTGVSGSGKSTLLNEILAKSLSAYFYNAKESPGEHKKILGIDNIDKVINIDQSPIGRTPRSNPATYTGVFTYIRDLFASVPEARMRGYKAGRFSFNVKGGRCEVCGGDGVIKIEMHFLPDVYVACEECKGKRYNKEALDIHYKGKNISDVLEMTVDEAHVFFRNVPLIARKLETLSLVGLGYMHLGQQATTLSGGEAQRIKLSSELSRASTGRTLYILDEPTTGLHFDDVKRLLGVLNRLVEKGNTVLVIEHNLDVIKSADWVIDLGPEGGNKGGQVVAVGTPEDVAKVKKSYTGQYLAKALKPVRV
ncbi:MAG: excinuclease ABC subunit A [Candidatus Doudnabacteria bacterium RIFCSPHIGHO2_02_FULL_42_25]|uniref:UvrABC system protein A n=1 Tax=Candidatus Doudnabacteria bacterium RIFCSPHIGHO2_01_FULL_41_86 TaxID=1817821 RepID=A0A1F5NA11_9BACT|nr:MAG: excinuclease ABC subunit A [Candidatus Doudnabacteria bacterium RIFCSPHIGHO2_01_FULL_41_86]OGE75516.1 MAG: excinuclease ABC subunit A [Candidatus Doudnabacteria bacterium RIFCSPHIGHO2_01_43_10]OGE85473.1 MAG: excinuclease ABC subunit A [Candidatus Doudnabacteria bacterium RIFCSPHIGHO2_12_FULL_42_22]OGE87011.1 MAG: excinuclease ABC subunit A [Candidatus Doudnabacteria bacterium RIFCSPHIGHO2_02_FULL_42_25]OGE92610.1 MAG: excinuclease ABC subunit A [Candidatus Doudnabacteria bacterium RIFC